MGVAGPSNGTASLSGAIATYTPNSDYSGADSFTFKANDGMVDSNVATVSIDVKTMVRIAGPWLWMTVETSMSGLGALNSGTDWLSQASSGLVTEAQVANFGVVAGQAVGNKVWK